MQRSMIVCVERVKCKHMWFIESEALQSVKLRVEKGLSQIRDVMCTVVFK